jgi:hypothetical protein
MAQRQQNLAEPVPPFYLRTLQNLESSLNAAVAKEKEAKKKMNANNARALTVMKQKVKKVVKDYEADLKKFQEVRLSKMFFIVYFLIIHRIRRHLSANIMPQYP